MDHRNQRIKLGITTGRDKPMNISKVIKNVEMSLIHNLNCSTRSTSQKLGFFIPER